MVGLQTAMLGELPRGYSMSCKGVDTHVEDTSYESPLVVIETDTAGSLDVCVFNVQISCAYNDMSDERYPLGVEG